MQNHKCCAIIVAAGSGNRMGNLPTTKQFMFLGREPIIKRTIRQFEKCTDISCIIVVAREDEIPLYSDIRAEYKKITAVVKGGENRVESVQNGLSAMPEDCDFVAIHDGARCLVTPDMISSVVNAAYETGAATAACPVTDTVKVISDDKIIESTPDRSRLWNAQTPQVFDVNIYKKSLEYCRDFTKITDDNSIVEANGVKVKVIDCTSANIKITTHEDLFIGEAILKMRGAEE